MFKQLVEIYQHQYLYLIEECTDCNMNNDFLNGELDLLYTNYSTFSEKIINAIDCYFYTNTDVYPIISKLFNIFITFLVPTAPI